VKDIVNAEIGEEVPDGLEVDVVGLKIDVARRFR